MSRRSQRAAVVVSLLLLLSLLPSGLALAARSTKSVAINLAFEARTDGCHPVATVIWTGYRSDHARFGFVPAGKDPLTESQFMGTYRTTDGHASEGSFTVVDPFPVQPGTWWQVDVLLRSPGGAHLWEGLSEPAQAPATCGV